VVGLNALQYFWDAKDPEGAGRDLGRIIAYYSEAWHKPKVALVGYSLGADVLPFMINRLPAEQRKQVVATALIGASTAVDFQFHVGDWFGDDGGALPVLPEANRLGNQQLLCVYGTDEAGGSLCPLLDQQKFRVAALPGGHHFGGDYQDLATLIMQHARSPMDGGGAHARP
jgi:type IV secretory pathway VirJ component